MVFPRFLTPYRPKNTTSPDASPFEPGPPFWTGVPTREGVPTRGFLGRGGRLGRGNATSQNPSRAGTLCWKATKEYLHQRGTRIRVFRVCVRTPFLPPFFPHFSPLFPLQAPCILAPLLPSSPPPFIPPFLAPGKVRFRYPSDLVVLFSVLQTLPLLTDFPETWGGF